MSILGWGAMTDAQAQAQEEKEAQDEIDKLNAALEERQQELDILNQQLDALDQPPIDIWQKEEVTPEIDAPTEPFLGWGVLDEILPVLSQEQLDQLDIIAAMGEEGRAFDELIQDEMYLTWGKPGETKH